MFKEPETYNDLIRTKRCSDLAKYFDIPKEILEEIWDFLSQNPKNNVYASSNKINLYTNNNLIKVETLPTSCSSVSGIKISDKEFKIYPIYTPSSSRNYYTSSGRSSNNNNNNHNNNNNNN